MDALQKANILFLTSNPNLESTTRILQSWLLEGSGVGLEGRVVVSQSGSFSRWLGSANVDHLIHKMRLPNRWRPIATLKDVIRVF